MNKVEIAEGLRREVGELEVTIKKVQARCDKLKRFVLDLEAEIEAAKGPHHPTPLEQGKLRDAIDRVFGEKPKRPKA